MEALKADLGARALKMDALAMKALEALLRTPGSAARLPP